MSVKIGKTVYSEFNDMWDDPNFIDPIQKAEIEFEVELIGKLVEAREQKGISQKQLAEMAGMKQPAIARLESGKNSPQVDTLIKLLHPLGYTLKIVPNEPDQPMK